MLLDNQDSLIQYNLFTYVFNNFIMYTDACGTAGQTLKPAPSQGVKDVVTYNYNRWEYAF